MREHFNVQVEVRPGDRIMVNNPTMDLGLYSRGCTGVVQEIVLHNQTRRPVGVRVKWDKGQLDVYTTTSMLYFTEFVVLLDDAHAPKGPALRRLGKHSAPFWNPRSGFLGGLVMGVLLAALTMGIAYYWGKSEPIHTPYREFKL